LRLSINQYICPTKYPLENFLKISANSGAEAVGINANTLESVGTKKLKSLLKNFNLNVSSLNSAGYFLYNTSSKSEIQHKKNLTLIQHASEIEAETLCVIVGGISHGNWTLENARNEIFTKLSKLTEESQKYGVKLGLEPIHPIDLHQKGCVNSISSAIDLVNNIPNLGIILDFFHSWWDPDLLDFFNNHMNKISLIQFCNIIEINQDMKPYRNIPLNGSIDISMLFHKAITGGYNKLFEFELFDRDLRGRSVEDVIKSSANQFFNMSKK